MNNHYPDNFAEFFSGILARADIKRVVSEDSLTYNVYQAGKLWFKSIYYKEKKAYVFQGTDLLKSAYKEFDIPEDTEPSPKDAYETAEFFYKLRGIIRQSNKNVSIIYNEILVNSDIILQMRGDFETYMVVNSGYSGYAIGYNPETNQYGFKRYELINTLYKICNVPMDRKPNYAKLYKRTKEYYMVDVAMENMKRVYD